MSKAYVYALWLMKEQVNTVEYGALKGAPELVLQYRAEGCEDVG